MSDDENPILGVIAPMQPRPRHGVIPVEEREALVRTAAAILQESGAGVDAGQIIVLAGWLGGMD